MPFLQKMSFFFFLFSGHLQTLLCLIESMAQHIQFVVKLLVFHEYFMESSINLSKFLANFKGNMGASVEKNNGRAASPM